MPQSCKQRYSRQRRIGRTVSICWAGAGSSPVLEKNHEMVVVVVRAGPGQAHPPGFTDSTMKVLKLTG